MNDIIERLHLLGILPVVKLDKAEDVLPLAQALRKAGIQGAEITFRTPAAAKAIRLMKETYPDMLAAAGTVLTVEQAAKAKEAGADLLVSPGIDPDIVNWAQEHDILMIPGCMSPTDVSVAASLGLDVVKFFPAQTAGGPAAIQALSAPFPHMKFMPSGGIHEDNMLEYLKMPQVVAIGGSWMTKEGAAAPAVKALLDFRLAHIGINAANEKEARQIADLFETVFGFEARENPSSIFSDTYVETVKTPYLGKNGHMAISTPDVERAVYYLKQKGVAFNDASIVYRDSGLMQCIYLAKEIGGFAIHLVRKD